MTKDHIELLSRVFSNRFIFLTLAVTPLFAFAHGGGLNAEGCHKQKSTGDYHCHGGNEPIAVVKKNEVFFNTILAKHLDGTTEKIIDYYFDDKNGKRVNGQIRVDVVTATEVIEGGLDKRSSFDSIQQAIFASLLTDKEPAVAIYDTDGKWGKIEHRIHTVAKELSIKFYWISGENIETK